MCVYFVAMQHGSVGPNGDCTQRSLTWMWSASHGSPWIAMDGDVGTKDAIAIGLAAIEGTFGIGTEDALGIASEGALGIASGLAAIRGAH